MNEKLRDLKQALIENITDFMLYGGAVDEHDPEYDPDFDAGYSQEQIDRCSEILETFFSQLQGIAEPDKNTAILKAVKLAVLNLNEVNDLSDGCMIETEQREQLYEIITLAAEEAGLVSPETDITEAWREW